jgi:hypothetical protein
MTPFELAEPRTLLETHVARAVKAALEARN